MNTIDSELPQAIDRAHRILWTTNANVLSILYAGSEAMKTDYTLTGVRSWKGEVSDGLKGIQRYFVNNFADYRKQNSIDLLLGRIDPQRIDLADDLDPFYVFLWTLLILFGPLFSSVGLLWHNGKSLNSRMLAVLVVSSVLMAIAYLGSSVGKLRKSLIIKSGLI